MFVQVQQVSQVCVRRDYLSISFSGHRSRCHFSAFFYFFFRFNLLCVNQGSAALPGKKKTCTTYLETDMDTYVSVDVGASCSNSPLIEPTKVPPIYVNTDPAADDEPNTSVVYEPQDINDADERMKRFYGLSYVFVLAFISFLVLNQSSFSFPFFFFLHFIYFICLSFGRRIFIGFSIINGSSPVMGVLKLALGLSGKYENPTCE